MLYLQDDFKPLSELRERYDPLKYNLFQNSYALILSPTICFMGMHFHIKMELSPVDYKDERGFSYKTHYVPLMKARSRCCQPISHKNTFLNRISKFLKHSLHWVLQWAAWSHSVQHLRNCFIIMSLKSSAAFWYYKLRYWDRNYTCIPQGTKCSVQGTSIRERQGCALDWESHSSKLQSDCNSRELGWQQSLTLRQQQKPKGYNLSA